MYSLKIDELKKLLENMYNGYLNESTRSKYIIELGKFFNIDVHYERIKDYKVLNIDVDNLSIEIRDERYGVSYKSFYTNNCDMLNYYGDVLRFIIVDEISDERYLERIYNIGDVKPIITRMIFEENEYALVFEKEESISEDTFLDSDRKLTIRYLKSNSYEMYEPLLTRVVKVSDSNSFEQTNTYSDNDKIKEDDSFNITAYVVDDSVVYVVNEVSFDKPISYFKGICIENMSVYISKYMPRGIDIKNYKRLTSKDVLSTIILKGIIEDNLHILEVYKE